MMWIANFKRTWLVPLGILVTDRLSQKHYLLSRGNDWSLLLYEICLLITIKLKIYWFILIFFFKFIWKEVCFFVCLFFNSFWISWLVKQEDLNYFTYVVVKFLFCSWISKWCQQNLSLNKQLRCQASGRLFNWLCIYFVLTCVYTLQFWNTSLTVG